MANREFNTGEPLGYFITWTTYGTWLPGDERGWQRHGKAGIQQPNQTFREMAAADLQEPAFHMEDADRQIVDNTVARHCEIRNWVLHVCNARTNHVHVVVTAPGYKPDVVRDQFKAWCTRHLKSRHIGRERFWTEGASCRWINHPEDLESAIQYAADAQDRKDRKQHWGRSAATGPLAGASSLYLWRHDRTCRTTSTLIPSVLPDLPAASRDAGET